MAQFVFSGSSGNISDLNANFNELYSFYNLITVSGSNVGLGHTPSAKFDVNGQIRAAGGIPMILAGSGGTCYLSFYRNGVAGARTGYVGHGASSDEMHIVADNNTSIGFWTNSVRKIDITGASGIQPTSDNAIPCGGPANRFTVYWAASGTISTSDAREKTSVNSLSPAEIGAAKQLAGELGTFRFLDAVAKKGDEARMHVGMTVQRAMEIMTAHGLDPLRYGFICHDSWPEKIIPARTEPRETGLFSAEGAPMVEEVEVEPARVVPAGDRYAFRTDELLLFIARGFDARLTALEAAA